MNDVCALLSVRAASRKFGVTTKWLRAAVEAGHLTALTAGRRILFDGETLKSELRELARKGVKDAS